jgi:hypothetical protein
MELEEWWRSRKVKMWLLLNDKDLMHIMKRKCCPLESGILECNSLSLSLSLYIYIYIYMHFIYVHMNIIVEFEVKEIFKWHEYNCFKS